MLELANDPRYATISTPAAQAVELLVRVMAERPEPVIAEVGVGVGATSLALCQRLDNRGTIHFFDYEERVVQLVADLAAEGFTNTCGHANSRRFFDSYGWTLGKLMLERRSAGEVAMFDFIFFDGAHAFQFDAVAAVLLKELLKPGGILLMDDYSWSFAKSPTLRESLPVALERLYTDEQIEASHVKFVCDLFLDADPEFEKIDLGYKSVEQRRAYRKTG